MGIAPEIGWAVVMVVVGISVVRNYRLRHEPEPPNSRLKLPWTVILTGVCLALAVTGTAPVLFVILALMALVQAGFIIAGRNPWWMQAAVDKKEYVQPARPRQRR